MSDLISRADAIHILACEMYAEAQAEGYDTKLEDYIPEAKAWMNDAPSAEPEKIFCSPDAEWVPVSERLPDAEECPMDCMVTRKSEFIGNYVDMAVAEANGTWTHEDWKAITINGNATCISTRDADIIAWMPLPTPYKGGDDE